MVFCPFFWFDIKTKKTYQLEYETPKPNMEGKIQNF